MSNARDRMMHVATQISRGVLPSWCNEVRAAMDAYRVEILAENASDDVVRKAAESIQTALIQVNQSALSVIVPLGKRIDGLEKELAAAKARETANLIAQCDVAWHAHPDGKGRVETCRSDDDAEPPGSARDRVLEKLWWSVPGETSEDSQAEAARLLDAYRAEVLRGLLISPEKTLLLYALELAADQMASRNGFTDEDRNALESLREIAKGD